MSRQFRKEQITVEARTVERLPGDMLKVSWLVPSPWDCLEKMPGEKTIELVERKIDGMNSWRRAHQDEITALNNECRLLTIDDDIAAAIAYREGMEALYLKYPQCPSEVERANKAINEGNAEFMNSLTASVTLSGGGDS